MKTSIQYQGGMHFAGESESGHILHFDSVAHDLPSAGPTPMETVLQAAAACSAMDVVAILQKRRKAITSFTLQVEGERSTDHPKIFRALHINYLVAGPEITLEEVQKAVQLSQEKYCSVINMLNATVQVSYSVEVKRT